MNIAWISHFFPYPPAGGALQRSYHLLRETASRHRVHLISLRKERNRPAVDALEDDYPAPGEFCDRTSLFPIPSEETPFGRLFVLASGLWDSDPYDDRWLASNEIEEFLREDLPLDSYDVIHLDTLGLAQYGQWFGDTPKIMNHHNIESHMMARRAEQEGAIWNRWYLRAESRKLARWEREWCGDYADNLVVSSLDGERLEKVVPGASWTVIPNGVDTKYFQPENVHGGSGDGMVFVGRMSWYPNEDAVRWLLDEIWPALHEDRPERRLTLVGSSPPESLSREPDARNVRATGFVPDVRPFMNEAQIYICPIRTGGGTRLKILDAMAMGMPLVATEMSVEGLDLTEGEHYLRAETPQEYVKVVGELETDPDLRSSLAVRAREEAVQRFSWAHIGKRLHEAYRRAVSLE